MLWSHEYILTTNLNLRNYVVVGNEDTHELIVNNAFGKVTQIKVASVMFQVKNKQLLCTENEYNQNTETIRKYVNAAFSNYGNLNAESIDF